MIKIIFFQAHPDDLEFYCAHLIHFLASKPNKYDIKIASMTKGEYGTPKKGFQTIKGKKLGIIRTKELFRALAEHGISKDRVHFFGIIDGSVNFNKKTLKLIKEYIEEENPDIIFACEPRNTYYRHPDHMNTGKLVYYILDKNLANLAKKPKLYFYGSINVNFFWPFRKEDINFTEKLLFIHKSQFYMMRYAINLYKFLGRIYGRHIKGWKYAEGYRRVFYGSDYKKNKKMNLLQRIFLIINVKIWPEKVTIQD
ncbi:MAG: PIG-L deacetylase family protein [Promethearchaeota archaeon]